MRWARRLAVQSDVGELCFDFRSVRNRDHDSRSEQQHLGRPSSGGLGKPNLCQRSFSWHHACYGWRVKFK
jgi:hypothetical protein